MDKEMMRILEILRPLWPGLVRTYNGTVRLTLDNDKVRVDVETDGHRWSSTVWVDNVVAFCHRWSDPEQAAPVLENQAKRARERTEALMGALGLEVPRG